MYNNKENFLIKNNNGVTVLCTHRTTVAWSDGGKHFFERHFCGECVHNRSSGRCSHCTVFGNRKNVQVQHDWIACEAFQEKRGADIITQTNVVTTTSTINNKKNCVKKS